MQSDQPDDSKKRSKKDRKGRKNKKKRDKGTKGKGKRKGKGKKGSRKKKQEEESVHEDGFLSVSATLSEYLLQEQLQSTEVPEMKKTTEVIIPTEVFVQTLTEMPTPEPDSTIEAPTVLPSSLPEAKFTVEVVYL